MIGTFTLNLDFKKTAVPIALKLVRQSTLAEISVLY